jgi:hypothetical protein
MGTNLAKRGDDSNQPLLYAGYPISVGVDLAVKTPVGAQA